VPVGILKSTRRTSKPLIMSKPDLSNVEDPNSDEDLKDYPGVETNPMSVTISEFPRSSRAKSPFKIREP
jgi:hypothetical protein